MFSHIFLLFIVIFIGSFLPKEPSKEANYFQEMCTKDPRGLRLLVEKNVREQSGKFDYTSNSNISFQKEQLSICEKNLNKKN